MNRIPITLLTGAIREREELQRRMRLIQDKPIQLGTHYSADETPDGDRAVIMGDQIKTLPPPIAKLDRERRRDSWVGTVIIIFTLTCAGWAAVKFAAERFLN